MLPRNTGWRPALWCLCPCINGSGFVAWFSCMFLLRGPASAFRFCQHWPCSPAFPCGAAGAGAASLASGSLSQSSLRMYVSPSCSLPRLCSPGCVRAEGRGGGSARAPPARAGALLHSGRVPGPHLLLCPQGCRSPSGSRPRCPLWSRCSMRVAGCEGTQRGQSGGQGFGEAEPSAPRLSPRLGGKLWGPGHVIFLSQSK